jgi:LacI family transcriptional regulator
MAKRPTTLHDVAKRAGVHFSTVSRALNPQTRQLVSAKVARKVAAAATALKYRPNEAAVGLRTRKSFLINILLPNLTEPGHDALVKGVRERFLDTRYVAIVGDEQRLAGQERLSLRSMKLRPIGGLIVAIAKDHDNLVREAAQDDLPLVEILSVSRNGAASSVTVDYVAGTTKIVGLLQSLGHERIGLVAHSPALSTGVAERAAFHAAIKNAGLDPAKALHECCEENDFEAGQHAFRRLRERLPDLTAVIAMHDKLALGCIDGVREAGLSCPKDISVFGFGDLPLTDRTTPPLTTMRIDYGGIGRLAAGLIMRAIEEPEAKPLHYTVEPVLIRRGSAGKARR